MKLFFLNLMVLILCQSIFYCLKVDLFGILFID